MITKLVLFKVPGYVQRLVELHAKKGCKRAPDPSTILNGEIIHFASHKFEQPTRLAPVAPIIRSDLPQGLDWLLLILLELST